MIRNTREEDIPGIIALSEAVYRETPPWREEQLRSHLSLFPEGQLVAALADTGRVVGMAGSLIIRWDNYEEKGSWKAFTGNGYFTNHDTRRGRTLYGAEVMVHPEMQRRRIGKRLYKARRELALGLGVRRIRAGARLRGYHRYAKRMTAADYVKRVISGEIKDPTLSFQLREGFKVFGVIPDYTPGDPESLGYAALIEWLNPDVSKPGDSTRGSNRFYR